MNSRPLLRSPSRFFNLLPQAAAPALALLLAAGVTARAADIRWANAAGGSWTEPANWSSGAIPGPADRAVIDLPGDYVVTIPNSASVVVGGLLLGGSSGVQFLFVEYSTLTLNGPGVSQPSGIFVLQGTLAGTGNLVLNGPFETFGGTLQGSGILQLNGESFFAGPNNVQLRGRALVNAGVLKWSGGFWDTGGSSAVTNLVTGVIEVAGDVGTSRAADLSPGYIYNAGLVRKTSGDLYTVEIEDFLINKGTIQLDIGRLALMAGAENSGQNKVGAGATLVFGGGTNLLTATSTVSGAGNVSFEGGAIEIYGAYSLTGTNLAGPYGYAYFHRPGLVLERLELSTFGSVDFVTGADVQMKNLELLQGTVGGTDDLILQNRLLWRGGGLKGAGRVVCRSGALLNTATKKELVGRTLINLELLNWTDDSPLYTGRGSVISNAPGATFIIGEQAYGTLKIDDNAPPGHISNAGFMIKRGTPDHTTSFYDSINNLGLLQVEGGVLHCWGPCTNAAGETRLIAGTKLEIAPAYRFWLTGGRLSGNGLLKGDVTSAATISPGLPFTPTGTLTLEGIYSEKPGAVLEIELGGLSASGFDQLVILGEAWLGGTLKASALPGFTPPPGAVFNFLAGIREGNFSSFVHPMLPGAMIEYGVNGASLRIATGGQNSVYLPPPLYFEDFESAPEGALPPGWRANNFTDPDVAGPDLNNPKSDSYQNWLVISRERVNAIGALNGWDAARRLRVKPGQYVNGTEVTSLINGKFAYAESDQRAGGQVQFLFSPEFDLSGKKHIYLSFHSIYEQNQNSLGTVEYSIDGGVNWWPVVYMLDAPDVFADPMKTFFTVYDDVPRYYDPATSTTTGGYYGAYIASRMLPILGPYVSARIDNDPEESKRVEIFRLPQADDQATVRFRFTQAGAASWYFGIDNFGLYSIPPMSPPVITVVPQSQMVAPGATATLRVIAAGPDLTYEWRFNGTSIGNNNETLVIPGADWEHSGVYQVVVSNPGGRTVAAATIQVTAGGVSPDPRPMPTAPDNPGFEQGLTGWGGTGNAFQRQPTLGHNVTVGRVRALQQHLQASIGGDYWQKLSYPIGHRGDYWVGTGDDRPNTDTLIGSLFSDEPTGTLYSRMFQISHSYMSFLIGGTEDIDSLRVELLVEVDAGTPGALPVAGRWYVIAHVATGHDEELMRRVAWDISPYIGRRAHIRVQDYSVMGHLNVDDFRFSSENPYARLVHLGLHLTAPVVEHNGYYYDWDAPVWGLADLHTHPMSHLGFGGKLMHGRPDGTISQALNDCNSDHGGWGVDNPTGDYYRQLIMGVMDDVNHPHREGYHTEQYKQFRNWPVFSTISHQQMWYEWIRRAYDGGLRVMVALCVNNQLLARASKGDLAQDDKTVGDNQTRAMKEFAARHSDFMEIAYDPFQLRDIIRRGKLAVILGSELDDIGNFGKERVSSQEAARAELQRLYNDGIRYIFPVHLTDNPFGGTAVGETILDIANKYVNGVGFSLEASLLEDRINVDLEDLDYTEEAVLVGIGAATLGPMLPALAGPILDAVVLSHPAGSAGVGVASALLPLALIGVGNEVLLNQLGLGPIPFEVWPLAGHYQSRPATYNDLERGHKNTRDLQPLGAYAVREMMRLGMMIDVDHMSQRMLTNVFRLARQVPGGYPLNSGHNSPRGIGEERSENHRTDLDYQQIRSLGGLVGVGTENSAVHDFDRTLLSSPLSMSGVPNDCAGTSKTFAQNYLYAFEHMGGRGLALGTDANGFIAGPGPRFGPQSAFAISENVEERAHQVLSQPANGVRYSPQHGRPLTTPAFVGPAVDPDADTGTPARQELGYAYNKDQRDFFAGLQIFLADPQATPQTLETIEGALNDSYPEKRRVRDYARGLVKAAATPPESPGWDVLSPDTESREKIAIAVYNNKMSGTAPTLDASQLARYQLHCKVWDDYHKIFGNNAPLRRCQTLNKQWDYNFEGMAHYGLIPDFFQDLANVGLLPQDMSALFNSADDFATMWTRTLAASAEFTRPKIQPLLPKVSQEPLSFRWFADPLDVLESTGNPADPASWREVSSGSEQDGYKQVDIPAYQNNPPQYFRVRKQP